MSMFGPPQPPMGPLGRGAAFVVAVLFVSAAIAGFIEGAEFVFRHLAIGWH